MNDIKNLSLLLDFYELTMAAVYFKFKPQAKATFDLFVRELPRRRAFLIACGLDDVILYLKNFSFTASDMAYLKKLKFSADFLKYLSKLRFTGECWAVKEGTIVFPQEPIVRITAPIIEAQIVESYLLNVINLQTTLPQKPFASY